MAKVKNELPVAVHVASGGDARVRVGSQVVSLNGINSGSFQVTGGTRFRMLTSLRTGIGLVLLVGYAGPVTVANMEMTCDDYGVCMDDVPEGTTVHFTLVDATTLEPAAGGTDDRLHVTFYG